MQLKKVARRILIVLFVVLTCLFLLSILLPGIVRGKASVFFSEKVSESSSGKYSLYYSQPTISLLSGTITFQNVTLLPNVRMDSTSALYSLAAREIKLSGISIWQLFNDRLNADKLSVHGGLISVRQGSVKKDSLQEEASEKFIRRLDQSVIRGVELDDITLNVTARGKAGRKVFFAQNGILRVKNLSVRGKLLADSFAIRIGEFQYHLVDELYTVMGKSIYSSSSDSLLHIELPQFVPSYGKREFGEVVGYQISRVKVRAASLELDQLDVMRFLEENELVARKLILKRLVADIYRDTNIPFRKIARPSLQEILMTLPLRVDVKTTELFDGIIRFELLSEGEKTPGKIFISQMDGLVTGLQNFAEGKEKVLSFSAKGKMYGKGGMYLYCSFPFDNRKEHFLCSGSIDSMSMYRLNSFVTPNLKIDIESGKVDSAQFSFRADDGEANGKLKLFYHDLKIGFREKKSIKDIVLAPLVNKVFIRDNNPDKNGHVREGTIRFSRNPYRYFPYYICHAVMSAVPDAIGIPLTISTDGYKRKE